MRFVESLNSLCNGAKIWNSFNIW